MRGRRVLVGLLVVAVLVAAGFGAKAWWDADHRTDFQQALSLLPASTQRMSWTDWSGVRRTLHVPAGRAAATMSGWMGRAYNRDYSPASTLTDSAGAMQREYGVSPANLDWEAYSQSRHGAVLVLRVGDSVDLDTVGQSMTGMGYRKPAQDGGVWRIGSARLSADGANISSDLDNVVLLPDQHLFIASESSSLARETAQVAQGNGDSLAGVNGVGDMAGKTAEPVAAVLWARDFACSDLAMSKAAPGEQQEANALIARAGPTNPLTGLLMAMTPDRNLTVAEEFESSDQADANLRTRARLAVGPAIGRGQGSFSDDYRLTLSQAQGSTVLLRLHPRTPGTFVLSSLYDGPVLFATC